MSRLFSVVVLGAALCCLTAQNLLADDKPSATHPSDPFAAPAAKPAAKKKMAAKAAGEKPPKKPQPAAIPQPRPGAAEAAIEEALAKPTQWEFVESPLSDVIDFLKDQHCIEIQLDHRILEDVGIGSDTPVTKNLKGLSLRSALNLLLRDLNLTWIIQNEVLLITTPEEAESTLSTKAYDVSDLVVCVDKDDEPWDDYDTLIDMIVSTAKPQTWEDVGGPGSVRGASIGTAKVLVVSQTREVDDEIGELLAKIREVAKKNPNGEPPQRNKPRHPPKKKEPSAKEHRGADAAVGGKGMF